MDGHSGFYVYGDAMKRRTFIKCLAGIGSLILVPKRVSGSRVGALPGPEGRHQSAGYDLRGRASGCSGPYQNEDSAVNLEKGLIELEYRTS
jgi:hypothetical protein